MLEQYMGITSRTITCQVIIPIIKLNQDIKRSIVSNKLFIYCP